MKAGYHFGALIVDAVQFVPHSRPRLFIVGLRNNVALPTGLANDGPTRSSPWQPRGLLNAFDKLSPSVREKWIWWNLPAPPPRNAAFSDLVEDNPIGVEWHTSNETAKLLGMMSGINREKLEEPVTIPKHRPVKECAGCATVPINERVVVG